MMNRSQSVHRRVVMTVPRVLFRTLSCLLCFLFIAANFVENESRNALTTSWSSLVRASLSLVDKPEIQKTVKRFLQQIIVSRGDWL